MFYAGSGPTWLDGVYCSGREDRLVDCEHAPWGDEDCSHSEDIGLICGKKNDKSASASCRLYITYLNITLR